MMRSPRSTRPVLPEMPESNSACSAGLDTIVDEVGFQVFMEIESREEVARVVLVVHYVLISGAG